MSLNRRRNRVRCRPSLPLKVQLFFVFLICFKLISSLDHKRIMYTSLFVPEPRDGCILSNLVAGAALIKIREQWPVRREMSSSDTLVEIGSCFGDCDPIQYEMLILTSLNKLAPVTTVYYRLSF